MRAFYELSANISQLTTFYDQSIRVEEYSPEEMPLLKTSSLDLLSFQVQKKPKTFRTVSYTNTRFLILSLFRSPLSMIIHPSLYVPGHFSVLHGLVSISGPMADRQSLPSNWGSGNVHDLRLVLVPPPQVAVQSVHSLHKLYPPSTKERNKRIKIATKRKFYCSSINGGKRDID